MATVGKIKNILVANPNGTAFIDSIGEGAGVFRRAEELKLSVVSADFRKSAKTIMINDNYIIKGMDRERKEGSLLGNNFPDNFGNPS